MEAVTPVEASAPSMKKAQSKASTVGGTASGGPSLHGGVSATPQGAAAARGTPAPLHACQDGENDFAEVVVVFEPQGTSLMMGGLHPRVTPPMHASLQRHFVLPSLSCITNGTGMYCGHIVRRNNTTKREGARKGDIGPCLICGIRFEDTSMIVSSAPV